MTPEINIDGWSIEYEAIPLIGAGLDGNTDIDEIPEWIPQSAVTPDHCLTPQIVYSTASAWNANLIPLWEGEDLGMPLAKNQIDEIFIYGLSFWCQGDSELMDQCFRMSERYTTGPDVETPEWDLPEEHSEDITHGQGQIEWCNRTMDISYDGKYFDPDSHPKGGVRFIEGWQ